MENIDVLRQNGFEIDFDEGSEDHLESRRRLRLVAQPVSKSTVFDIKGGEMTPTLPERSTADRECQTLRNYYTFYETVHKVRWFAAARPALCSPPELAGRASWSECL